MRRSSYLLLNALLVLSLAMGLPSGARADADAPLPARVLWDTSHGVMGRYQPGRRYSTLASSLLEQGIAVEESSAGVTHVNLSPYKVLVVCLGSAWDTAYTSDEVTAIQAFVNAGGGLFILTDNLGCPVDNVRPVAQAFGTNWGTHSTQTTCVSAFAPHPIFSGVRQVCIVFGIDLIVSAPSVALAWDGRGYAAVSVASHGSGKVVVLSDINALENECVYNGDNLLFGLNVFGWLAGVSITPPPRQTRIYLPFLNRNPA